MLHLMLAMMRSSGSTDAWRSSNGASPTWNAAAAERLTRFAVDLADGKSPDPPPPEALLDHSTLIRGIAAYRRHPWQRTLTDPPAVWTEGSTRLLDYGGTAGPAPGPDAPTVVVVPSLVNRSYVLDLMPGRSMLRWLAANGVRPLLLDWGWPGPVERRFTLTDYIAGRLERALIAARAANPRLVVAGYCMGGLLAVAAAQRRPDLISALVLLATPWDFHADGADQPAALGRALPLLEPSMSLSGTLPVDVIQVLFAMLDPAAIADKFRAFARLDPSSERAKLFVALEDWLNDGVPLSAPVARECIGGWYGENLPARGQWHVAGLPVLPETLSLPTFAAIPGRDRIVPPDSAYALAAAIPNAHVHRPASGHVSMTTGAKAENVLWRPLRDWIISL
jgi:poly(3-hydroxyalkanoate) synthetase